MTVEGAQVLPDVATCDECLRELRDPDDRRHRYPFISCSRCGPRFTIVRAVPYRRSLTTMAAFATCDACAAEYRDPASRRHGDEAISCPDCGPTLGVRPRTGSDPSGGVARSDFRAAPRNAGEGSDPVAVVSEALRDRAIVAVKGLGGYRLACVAGDEQAVARLRSRVDDERSFAVMAADLEALEELADLGPVEAALLRGRDRPVVLARRRHDAPLAAGPACLGVMLPVSALDHLLLEDAGAPLAIAAGDPETADLVLTHDRPVHTAVGDSVLQVVGGRPQPLRRGRGAVPSALALPGDRHVLACGAELDSTFCLARAGRAWVSHHLGDLRSADALAAFQHSVRHFEHLFSVNPDLLAHDLHPDHLSTTYALAREGVEHVAVQHHHAHLAACLAEHGEPGPAVAAVFDGGGQGPDGTLWGGEILVGGLRDFERAGHLWPVPLPGGEQAAREPWRMACAWLKAAGDERPLPGIEPDRWRAAGRLAETGTPVTTSVGRLLAAVGALCDTEDAFEPTERGAYEFDTVAGVLDARPAILAARRDATRGVEAGRVVARFIHALADATADDCARLAADRGLELVVLTGDAFQDRHLLARAAARLARTGLRVLVPTRLPPNDGGISFGQAAVAATRSG